MARFVEIFLLISLLSSTVIYSQNKNNISGFVKDIKTGEELIGTNILIYQDSLSTSIGPITGSATNRFGYYVIPSLKNGKYVLVFKHLGYKTLVKEVILVENNNITLSVDLESEDIRLQEVIVEGKKEKEVITSTINVPTDILTKMPSLSGEVDLFKNLSMLPGVSKASEISSGLYVRGGSPDQTLTLVDGTILYNPSHMGNITSTFNSNALTDVRLIKGAFPSEYGGRLSSVLDVKLRSGTKEKEKGLVGLGLINSFALFEGPLGGSSTYIISGRYLYYDLWQKSIDENSSTPRYHFYDLNAKVNFDVSDKSVISLSAIYSKDRAYSPEAEIENDYDIDWENLNLSLHWLQVNTNRLLLNSVFSVINYQFSSKIGSGSGSVTSSSYFSNPDLTDLFFRQNAEVKWHQKHVLKTGLELALHNYNLLYSDIYTEALERDPYAGTDISSAEASVYMQTESDFGEALKTNIGARLSYFEAGQRLRFEPRVSMAYLITNDFILKAAYAQANQFLHLIIRNDISLPTDLWYPTTKDIKPSNSSQVVAGFDSYWFESEYNFSVEGFYKTFKNLYEFIPAPKLNPLDNSIEDQFTEGDGEAYGVEFFLNKRKGNFTGWIGYTLSWSKRQFDDLNGGKVFYPKYDRRNDFSLVLAYEFFENLNAGLTWVYATGERYTSPPGQFIFDPIGTGGGGEIQFNYSGINTKQFKPYHKLDLNLTYNFKWINADFSTYLNLYNVYNRHNPFAQYIIFTEDENGKKVPAVKQLTLFPFIPSIGISVKF